MHLTAIILFLKASGLVYLMALVSFKTLYIRVEDTNSQIYRVIFDYLQILYQLVFNFVIYFVEIIMVSLVLFSSHTFM